ncbi:RpnC/YadD family protein [Gracilibacillus timonensis]|uniref:hypothetical protein n=1 Tax=Gracilibacillus timonensis TaxID=1816696 RepID=UPI000824F49A|nr:hypothetical protein [Gracilibacillus timonensis]
MEIDPARMELLYGFFDTYLQLNEEEEKQVLKEIENLENLSEEEKEVVRHLPNSYYEMGMREGEQKGMEEGKQEGIREGTRGSKQEIALRMITKGMSVSEIAEITKLSEEEIKKLVDQ